MVPSKSLTSHFRAYIPFLGLIAWVALFLKLPEISNFFTHSSCKACLFREPYMELIGSGYFGILIAISLLFPSFPNHYFALGGWIWALSLSCILTYMQLPDLCLACLVAHTCNIFIWGIWFFAPTTAQRSKGAHFLTRLCLLFIVPISLVALFSSLNGTFVAYRIKNQSLPSLHAGDSVPSFTAQTIEGRQIAKGEGMILNFVIPDCPFCEEQFRILHRIKSQDSNSSFRIINISPVVLPECKQYFPLSEWMEDKEGTLRKLFKIHGYPTMYIVGNDEKIVRVIHGVPEGLKEDLQKSLRGVF